MEPMTAVIVLAIVSLIVGALIFGGSYLVYQMGNKEYPRPGETVDGPAPGKKT